MLLVEAVENNDHFGRVAYDHFSVPQGPTHMRAAGGISPVIAVDRRRRRPLHSQIYDAYRAGILNGLLSPGQRVPSTRELASELSVSRIPVLEAYSQLLAEGYFETRTGAGTFICNTLTDQITPVNKSQSPRPKGSRKASRRSQPQYWLQRRPWTRQSGAFSVGQLAFDHFPFQVWSRLLARHARKVNAASLNYSDPMGYLPFRQTLAVYLRTARGVRCDAEQIMVVSGSQQALDLCARVLLDPGDAVWMEEPGYNLMRFALAAAGCRLIPVPVDEFGLDVAAGIRLCRKARAAFVTPSHQFPLGPTMSASRRLQLLEWAQRAGAWIVEDDYDSEYRYETMPIASLQGLDQNERVIYIGTFSKTCFPSLRVGYLVIPPDLLDRFRAARAACDLCAPYLYQSVLADFMDQGHYARHIRKTRLIYAERRGAVVDALAQTFGDSIQILGAPAGMYLTITAPSSVRDLEIAYRAAEEKLWIWPLSLTYAATKVRQGFILGFGSARTPELCKAIERLGKLVSGFEPK
ncbi:MAG: PLP-dependent aminotransferase family protein [Acidobacteriaceae bacterium]|nr:PLP-dependent aminotransferase family protein [Acidobacteriaceae bacterium]